jgi:hypothetical protein
MGVRRLCNRRRRARFAVSLSLLRRAGSQSKKKSQAFLSCSRHVYLLLIEAKM